MKILSFEKHSILALRNLSVYERWFPNKQEAWIKKIHVLFNNANSFIISYRIHDGVFRKKVRLKNALVIGNTEFHFLKWKRGRNGIILSVPDERINFIKWKRDKMKLNLNIFDEWNSFMK